MTNLTFERLLSTMDAMIAGLLLGVFIMTGEIKDLAIAIVGTASALFLSACREDLDDD